MFTQLPLHANLSIKWSKLNLTKLSWVTRQFIFKSTKKCVFYYYIYLLNSYY